MSESEDPNNISGDVAEAGSNAIYTIETVEKITHISKDRIILYYQHGLVAPIKAGGEAKLFFDDQAVHQLRRIAFLLSEYGVNQDGLRMVATLINEVERLREEVRFLRER